MTPLQRITCSCAIAAATIGAACAPVTVTSFTQRGVDVAAYRTFAWERIDTGVPGDPRLDNNVFFHDYLRDAIERELLVRGYEHTSLQPDLYVHYHASAQQKVVAGRQDAGIERCRDCTTEVYAEGTLLIDLTDARTGALVWRGVAESGLTDAVNKQLRMEETVDRVVTRIFSQLPRRL
jgi:hypothetical protein